MSWEKEEVWSSWDKLLCAALHRPLVAEGLVAIFDNVVIPNLKNMAKSMAGFSKNPAILFAIFCQCSISNPAGVIMAPRRSVAILFNQEAGVFLRESSPSVLRVESVLNHSNERVSCLLSPQSTTSPVTIENHPDQDFGAGCQQAADELPTSPQRLPSFYDKPIGASSGRDYVVKRMAVHII